MMNYWRSPEAVWYTAGPYDQLHFGFEVDMKELARQTENNVEAHDDPDNIDGIDSGFYSGPTGAHLRNTLPSKSGYVCGKMLDVSAVTVLLLVARGVVPPPAT